jgi:hypothetical protein
MYHSKYALKYRLAGYLRDVFPAWVPKGDLEKMAVEWKYLNENSGRRLRELVRSGIIEVQYVKGQHGAKCAEYRYIMPIPKTVEEREIDVLKQLIWMTS